MYRAFLLGTFFCASFPVLLCASPSRAQESDSREIEEIQVTATRRPAQAANVSAALSIIGSETIQQNKLTTDALLMQPGVFLQQTTPGQGAAIVRGLKGSEVLHLVDGFRLNNAIFRNAPTQYFALVAPGSAERIEVLRGAPASLYGSDAVAGVVQLLTRKPRFDERGSRSELYLAYDAADLGKIARASFEAGDKRVAGLVSGEYQTSGDRRTGGGERIAPSDYEALGGRVAVSVTPNETDAWFFDLQYAKQPSTPRTDELVPGFGQTTPSSEEFLFRPNERVFAHVQNTRKDWLWSADWTFDAGWQRIVDDRITRNFGSQVRRFEENSSDLFGVTASAADETEFGSWIFGVDYYYDRVDSRRTEQDIGNGQTVMVTPRFPDGSTMEHIAAFGNVLYRIGDRHSLSGGLRISSIETDIVLSSTRQDDVSADIGWLFDASDRTQLTANLGYGFRAPNVFDLGTLGERPGNRFNIPNPSLDSEHVTQFDVGLRHQRQGWDVEVTLFTLHYTDRIASVLTGALTPDGREVVQSQNVSSADIRGVEAFVHAALTPSLSADVVLNYVYGEQSANDGSEEPADRIPPFNGRVSLQYQLNNTWAVEAYSLFAGSQDRLSERDVQDVRINPAGTPGWVTANFAAIWSPSEQLRATARLENIFDRRYRMHGSGIDAQGWNLILSLQYSR